MFERWHDVLWVKSRHVSAEAIVGTNVDKNAGGQNYYQAKNGDVVIESELVRAKARAAVKA